MVLQSVLIIECVLIAGAPHALERLTPARPRTIRARSAHDRNNRFQHEYLHALFNKDTSLTAPHHELQVRDVGRRFFDIRLSHDALVRFP